MLRRPAQKTFTAEVSAQITSAASQSTGQAKRVMSYDPQNYPVFEVPVSQKLLVYIPNHVVEAPDGSLSLRMDKFPAHPVREGNQYYNIRCINGQVNDDPQLNWDGSCPLCDELQSVWDLYRRQIADVAASKGISPDAPEAEELLKSDRADLVKARVIKEADVWYTFPIVVIQCEEKDGILTPKLVNGQLVGTPMWYSIRERSYIEKWGAGFDALDGEIPSSPAGLWAVLNFTYSPKSGKCDKMGSAKALRVAFKTMEGYSEWATYYDSLTADWTPAKAQEVVVLDAVRSMEETREVAETIIKPVKDKLAMYELSGAGVAPAAPANGVSASAASALEQFGGVQAPAPAPAPGVSTPTQGVPTPATGVPLTAEMPSAGVQ